MNVRNEIKAQIIRTGMTMQEVVDLLSDEYGWSDSVSKQKALEKKNDELTAALEKSEKESTVKKLQEMRLHSDYERIKGILDRIPPEIIRAYTHRDSKTQEVRHYR